MKITGSEARKKWIPNKDYDRNKVYGKKRELLEKARGSIEVHGVFRDDKPTVAYIEDEKKGKLYGCSVPFRCSLNREVMDATISFKRTLICTLKLAKKRPWSLIGRTQDILDWIYENYTATLRQKVEVMNMTPLIAELYTKAKPFKSEKEEGIVRGVLSIFQADNAYHTYLYDFLLEIRKQMLKLHPRFELKGCLKLVYSRMKNKEGMKKKFDIIFWFINFIPPKHIRKIKKYILSLDIKLEDPEKYYAFRKTNYDFRGLPYEERMKWVREVDEENEHIIFE